MTLSASFALPWFVTDNCGRMATLSKYTAKVKIRSEEINHNKEWKIILTWEFLYLHLHEIYQSKTKRLRFCCYTYFFI